MYSWVDIARRTEKVYNDITSRTPLPLIDRLKRYYGCGAWAGKLFCLLVALDFLLLLFLAFCFPGERIDVARDWPKKPVVVHQNGKGKGKGKGKKGDRLSIVFRQSMGNGTDSMGNV
jgi:phosphatidylinositol N-acetylglucosaminyltransferase subunit A